MKVIHIDSEKYFGGGQNQIYLLNKYLLKNGVKSIVFCPENSPLFFKLKRNGYEVYPLNLKSVLNFIRRENPDILHIHSGKSLTISHIIKILNPNLKIVFTRRIARKIKFCFLRKFLIDAVICISEEVKKYMKKCFPENKIFVVFSGVEKNEEKISPPEWYERDKFIVGNIAHLFPYKDHITLIKGFYEFLKIYPDSLLVIMGEGSEREGILKVIDDLNIKEKVILKGFVPDATKYIRYFSVFVITSIHTEGLCSSIIDAFMQGVPVVATDAGGIKELVKDGITGILIEKKNPEKLKYALLKIREDMDFVKKIVKNAYNFSLNFTAEKMAEGNLRVYRKLRECIL